MEMKLKAWQKFHKKMVDVTEIRFDGSGKIKSVSTYCENQCPRSITYSNVNEDFWLERDGESCLELIRYTGINDSEGNEIYEGDIIQLWEKTVNGNELTHICSVYKAEKGTWMMEGHLESDSRYRTRLEVYSHRKNGEVVGNIYEFPELVKKAE